MKIYHRKRGTLTSDATGHDWTQELPQLEAPRTNDQAVRLSSWVARKKGSEGRRGVGINAGQSRIKFYDILRRTKVEQVHWRQAH